MNTGSASHRKLIDIKPSVFDSLSREAGRRGISLKKHIENILEAACPKRSVHTDSPIAPLIGSAIPAGKDISSIKDERLDYLLSK